MNKKNKSIKPKQTKIIKIIKNLFSENKRVSSMKTNTLLTTTSNKTTTLSMWNTTTTTFNFNNSLSLQPIRSFSALPGYGGRDNRSLMKTVKTAAIFAVTGFVLWHWGWTLFKVFLDNWNSEEKRNDLKG